MSVLEGTVAFVNLTETEVYRGQDTGKYNITVAFDDATASDLENAGVKVKDYKGTAQRKFSSKFPVTCYNVDGEEIPASEISWGDKVRIKYNVGNPSPQWGTPTYVNAVKLLEKNPEASADDGDF